MDCIICVDKFEEYKRKLLSAFCFWGPMGNLIPVLPMVPSFRLFYIIVFTGMVLFFVEKQKTKIERQLFVVFIPIIAYAIVSSLLFMIYGEWDGVAENPIVRFMLLLSMFTFAIHVSGLALNKGEINKQIKYYLIGYIISLFAGYIIFVGFYLNLISFDSLSYVEVLPQIGYGLLRFSPGSYPNEYGNVSSFVLSVLTYYLIFKVKVYSKMKLYILYFLVFAALILTTTRAAYISYIVCFLFLLFRKAFSGQVFDAIKIFLYAIIFVVLSLYVVQIYFYDITNVFMIGYEAFVNNEGSSAERFDTWEEAAGLFINGKYIFGCGFGVFGNMHNVYIQLLFELGLVGCFLLLVSIVLAKIMLVKKIENRDGWMIVTLGWMHILWFALSNHNINHHLTWFIIVLTLLHCKVKNLRF